MSTSDDFIWIGGAPWRKIPGYDHRPMDRCIDNLTTMWAACRQDGRPWWRRIGPSVRLALLPLRPWPVTIWWGRLTLYGWGWNLFMRGTYLVWAPREAGLYVSPDGTPSRATRWLWRTVAR